MESHREYLQGRLAAHVIGATERSSSQKGTLGIERTFDALLSGTPGKRTSIVDRARQRIEPLVDEYIPPVDGASVVLTIDAYVQARVEENLAEAVRKYHAKWGTAVVMDPQTGEVLAMATYPTFSPARPIPPGLSEAEQKAAREHQINRAVMSSFEPGSVFKPFIASMAIDEGRATLSDTFVINGREHYFGSRRIRDDHYFEVPDLADVLAKSSNIAMAMLGERLGIERLNAYVHTFGFGDPTGIDLPEEHPGLVQRFSRWNGYSAQSIPIGQEIAVTPIQLLTAFAALANDGELFRPRIVRGVIDAHGRVIKDVSRPISLRRVLSRETARKVRFEALARCVTEGTGDEAALPDYQVFGKTGTAQIADPTTGKYNDEDYVGSFVGGAPLERPRVVAIVSVYLPDKKVGHYGGTVAAPYVGRILDDTLKYLQTPPDIQAVAVELTSPRRQRQ
jgi:cell division protein FtsI/penicillin-binding protein 2